VPLLPSLRFYSNKNLTNEILGGFNVAILGLPVAITFGTVIFAPLGGQMAAIGILTCFIGAFIGGLLSALLGDSKVMISGPRSFAVVILAGLGSTIFQALSPEIGVTEATSITVVLIFFTSFLSGFFQIVIGLLKLGKSIKYIPYPIVSALFNLSALVIILLQVWPLLGFSSQPSSFAIADLFTGIQPLAIAVSFATISSMYLTKKHFTRLPPILVACSIGVVAHYLLSNFGFSEDLGETLPTIKLNLATIEPFISVISFELSHLIIRFSYPIIFSALSLAVLNSLSTLLTGLAINQLTDREISSNKELSGHGVANMIASFFGGVAITGKVANTIQSINAGSKGPTSAITSALCYVLIIFALTPFITYLPRTVLAGIAVYLSFGLFDSFGKNLLTIILRRQKDQFVGNFGNIAIVTTVLTIGIFYDTMSAIFAGLLVTIGEFVYKAANVSIGSVVSGQQRRSRVQRTDTELKTLKEKANNIVLLQLEGFLFFIVADQLAKDISKQAQQGVNYLILDVARISYLDQTGVTVLVQLFKRIQKQNKFLLFCGMNSSSQRYHHGNEWQLLLEGLPKDAFFQDADKALEWCENKTISATKTGEANVIRFEDCVLVKGMDTAQIAVIQQYFQTVDYQTGNIVIEDGSPGDSLFLIASGTLDVLSRPDNAHQQSKSLRLHTFSSGSLVGEMSFIDNQARSARVVSRGEARCYLLNRKDYQNLTQKHPELAIAIMSNISIVLSSRLRSANLTINHLSNQY